MLAAISVSAQVVEKKSQNNILSPKFSEAPIEPVAPTVRLNKVKYDAPVRTTTKVNESNNALTAPTKATRMTDSKTKNEIVINIDPKKSDLDNTLNLIEEKENVNKYNSSLTNTSEYKQLLSKISFYKNNFNQTVKNKGIENCSVKEQNYFLAFLKEEGKEKEYLTAVSKIK